MDPRLEQLAQVRAEQPAVFGLKRVILKSGMDTGDRGLRIKYTRFIAMG